MSLCWVDSVVGDDSVFDFVQPTSRAVISSVESEEENIYDCPRAVRGLFFHVLIVLTLICVS